MATEWKLGRGGEGGFALPSIQPAATLEGGQVINTFHQGSCLPVPPKDKPCLNRKLYRDHLPLLVSTFPSPHLLKTHSETSS